VEPINNVKQGNYEPIVKLVPPTKIQIATVTGKFNPTDKSMVDFELGISNNDLNLFSSQDDSNNKGLAGKVNTKQRLFSGKWNVDIFANYQFVQKDFKTIERLYSIEFNRDWNITTVSGSQSLLASGLNFTLPKKGIFTYQFEKLDFTQTFSGNRHSINGLFRFNNWTVQNQGSLLKSDETLNDSKFIRNQTQSKYHFNKTGLEVVFD